MTLLDDLERADLALPERRIRCEQNLRNLELHVSEHPESGPLLARIRDRLSAIDQIDAEFEEEARPLREQLRAGTFTPEDFRRVVFQKLARGESPDHWAEWLLGIWKRPRREKKREAAMTHYAPTCVMHILELIDRAPIGPSDLFYDLGSGLGKVSMLVGWLTGARSIGVEYEPSHARVATMRARELGLGNVDFLCADAREVDLSSATVLYLFLPFKADILHAVLREIEALAERRPLTVGTVGMNDALFPEERWSKVPGGEVALFRSR